MSKAFRVSCTALWAIPFVAPAFGIPFPEPIDGSPLLASSRSAATESGGSYAVGHRRNRERLLLEEISDEFSKKVLEADLAAAEEQYTINFERMRKKTDEGKIKYKKITKTILQSEFLLPTYPCALEGRFGLWGEGGKWVCLKHFNAGKTPVVLSIGSKGDESFERDMSDRLGAFSHTFDFSLDEDTRKRMESYTFLKFYNAGLAVSASALRRKFPDSTFYTLPELLVKAGLKYVDIFKIDCEGCEHSIFKEMEKQYTRDTVPFGQIQVEVHNLRFARPQVDFLRRLEDLGFRMFHAEINPFWGGEGYELAYIHESLVKPGSASRS